MTWLFAEMPEVARRTHKAASKMILPDAIDDDTGRERIFGTSQPTREFSAPPGAVGHTRQRRDQRWPFIEHGEESRLDRLLRFFRNEHRRRHRPGVRHDQRLRQRRGFELVELRKLFQQRELLLLVRAGDFHAAYFVGGPEVRAV